MIPHPAGYPQINAKPLHLKDQAVQTEITSSLAAHSDFDTSHDIPESRELFKQVSASSPPATTHRGSSQGGTGAMTTTLQS